MYHVPHAHKRGTMKHGISRAPEHLGSRSPAFTRLQSNATGGSKGLSSTSTALIVSIALTVAILIILGVYIYVRHRRHKYNAKNCGSEFNKDDFADPKKKSPSSPELVTKLNSSNLSPTDHYHKSSSITTSDDRTIERQSQGKLPFRIAHENAGVSSPTLAFPKLAAQKGKPLRSKPVWLSPIMTEEEARSPLPAYGMSSAGQEILIPTPPQKPPQKAEETPILPTPPVARKSRASSIRPKTSPTSVVIPDHEPVPVSSPARSESFAPKDLTFPSLPTSPASSTSVLDSARIQNRSSRVGHNTDVKLPRLMSVVSLFTPNLPDELYVKIGDTVRVIEEYKDGWCFVQFLGRKDASRGMVPLVCLQQRKRLVPLTHNASKSSSMTLNWR